MQPTTTQLAKKLLIKTAQHWLFLNSPDGFSESFAPPDIEIKTKIAAEGILNGILLFVKNNIELKTALPELDSILKPETVCWIAYPKKSSGMVSDLEIGQNWKSTI